VEVDVPDLESAEARESQAKTRPIMIAELQALRARAPLSVEVVREVAAAYGIDASDAWCEIWTAKSADPRPIEIVP
jgi:hypothetical protein